MRPPTVQSLSVWSLLATGDFALSARKLQGPPSFAVARTPQRSLFFTTDPSAFSMLPRCLHVTFAIERTMSAGAVVLLVRREMTGCVGASNFA